MQRQPGNDASRRRAGRIDDQRRVERRIAALASRQHGVVTRAQLLAAGLGPGAIDHRVRSGRLHVLHRGVYLVGHATPTWRTREIGAVLACGPTAVLSHRSAAAFWEVLAYPASSADIDVTATKRGTESKPGIRVHRARTLGRRDYVIREGIPVTTPARTILDLAASCPAGEVERAVGEGIARGLLSEPRLRDQLDRNRGRQGAGALRALIDLDGGPAASRSEAERRLLRLVRAAGLPIPESNALVGGFEVDFIWRRHRLIVEVDGYRFHSSRPRFEHDCKRDASLAALGYTVLRVTWRQLTREPEAVVARLAAALARRG
jgi:very-short-patch-repair endonuclease